jgi:hypothetical protein
MELNKMIDGYQVRREDKVYRDAWFFAMVINAHPVKKAVMPKELAKPFLRQKSIAEKEREKEDFMESFKRQRKEALKHGDDS